MCRGRYIYCIVEKREETASVNFENVCQKAASVISIHINGFDIHGFDINGFNICLGAIYPDQI